MKTFSFLCEQYSYSTFITYIINVRTRTVSVFRTYWNFHSGRHCTYMYYSKPSFPTTIHLFWEPPSCFHAAALCTICGEKNWFGPENTVCYVEILRVLVSVHPAHRQQSPGGKGCISTTLPIAGKYLFNFTVKCVVIGGDTFTGRSSTKKHEKHFKVSYPIFKHRHYINYSEWFISLF